MSGREPIVLSWSTRQHVAVLAQMCEQFFGSAPRPAQSGCRRWSLRAGRARTYDGWLAGVQSKPGVDVVGSQTGRLASLWLQGGHADWLHAGPDVRFWRPHYDGANTSRMSDSVPAVSVSVVSRCSSHGGTPRIINARGKAIL